MTNLAARNKGMRTEVLHSISNVFQNLLSIPIPEDINEVVVGLPPATIAKTLKENEAGSGCKVWTLVPEVDLTSNQEVKDTLAKLASTVAETSGRNIDVEDLLKGWTSLLASAEFAC